MKKHILLSFVFILSFSNVMAETTPTEVLKQVCEKNNLFELKNKNKLAFTFNAKLPQKTISRNWEWNIKTNEVFLDGKIQKESQKFTNDIYWLMFPLKAFQDRKQTTVKLNKDVMAPISKKKSAELVIGYFGDKGYTPNDVYKLYLNDKFEIIEWSYLKGGKSPPARSTTWGNYKIFNGISFSLTRESPGGFKIWFENIIVE